MKPEKQYYSEYTINGRKYYNRYTFISKGIKYYYFRKEVYKNGLFYSDHTVKRLIPTFEDSVKRGYYKEVTK